MRTNSQISNGQNLDISLTFVRFDLWTSSDANRDRNPSNGTRNQLDHRHSCVVLEGSHILGSQVHSLHLVLRAQADDSHLICSTLLLSHSWEVSDLIENLELRYSLPASSTLLERGRA